MSYHRIIGIILAVNAFGFGVLTLILFWISIAALVLDMAIMDRLGPAMGLSFCGCAITFAFAGAFLQEGPDS